MRSYLMCYLKGMSMLLKITTPQCRNSLEIGKTNPSNYYSFILMLLNIINSIYSDSMASNTFSDLTLSPNIIIKQERDA